MLNYKLYWQMLELSGFMLGAGAGEEMQHFSGQGWAYSARCPHWCRADATKSC